MGRRGEILYSVAGLSLVAALAHVWAMPEHFGEWWGYGGFFLVVAIAQGLYGLGLLRRPARAFLLLGAVGNFGIVSLSYVLTMGSFAMGFVSIAKRSCWRSSQAQAAFLRAG